MPGDFGVLLDRGVARLQDDCQCLRHVADHAARGSEVEQQRLGAAGEQDHVVGRDVAVVAVLGMDHRQRLGQRGQQRHQPGLVGRRAGSRERVLQRDALVERHHHVGGAVRLPEAVHLDQRRMVELRQQLGLVDEALQAGLERVAMALGLRLHRSCRRARPATTACTPSAPPSRSSEWSGPGTRCRIRLRRAPRDLELAHMGADVQR